MTEAVINTSFLTAFLCFIVAGANAYLAFNGWGRRPSTLSSVSWFLFGICFILTQFGGDWFTINQRAWFRIATNLVLGAQIYSLASMYNAIKPFIDARRNTYGIDGHNGSQ